MKGIFTALGSLILAAAPAALSAHVTPAQWQSRQSEGKEAFRWAPKSKATVAKDWRQVAKTGNFAKAVKTGSDVSLPSSESAQYLDMPDGTTWFISIDFDKTVISQEEYYTDYDITGLKATIWNDKFEKVGYIETSIEKPEGFDKCSNAEFGATVTKKFFNTDDNYEVMLMANFKPTGGYGAVPYTYVFSLKGPETPADHIETLNGYYTAAVNNAADAWSEDFFIEFFSGEEYTDTQMLYTFDIYSKASYANKKASKIKTFTVDMVYVMSDGENEALPVAINSKGNTLYATVSKYEKTFFEDPFDFTNEKLNEDNHYVVELYKKGAYDQEMTLQSTTSIPCLPAEEGFSMQTYCLGMFEGIGDITFDFSAGDTPDFIITVSNSDIYDNVKTRFDVVNTAGEVIKTFGEGNEGYIRLSSVAGQPEQYCFLMPTGDGDLDVEFAMYDYPQMERKAGVPAMIYYNGYDVILSLLIDRVADGDSYAYAVASSGGESDASGDTSHLVAWFDNEGTLQKVDRLNGGKNINMLSPYVSANGLGRYLFNTDDSREYMMFAQRLNNDGTSKAHTELLVVNDREETLAQYSFATEDNSINVALVNEQTRPALWISYESYAEDKIRSEFIELPLNKFEGAGTTADPYLLKTPGDMERIAFNLNGNFKLANDIDYNGASFTAIGGQFSGSFNGAGHTISNFTLDGSPMFASTGRVGNGAKTFINDVNIRGVEANNVESILAGTSYATTFNNVKILDASVSGSEGNGEYGTVVSNAAMGTQLSECAVTADINLAGADYVGGLVATLGNDSRINASSFEGTISAGSVAGGIAAEMFASSSINDCHVTSEITAANTVGSIAGTSARGIIANCVAEGKIKATTPRQYWSDYSGKQVPAINAGGIVGNLDAKPTEYDQNGNPKEPDPNLPVIIKNCFVAVEEISIPDMEGLAATAHRIAGRTSINNDPMIAGETYNETTYEWETQWGDPSPAEDKIENCYVVNTALLPIDSTTECLSTSTEGETKAYDGSGKDFYVNLGCFHFIETEGTPEFPWVMDGELPALYFEDDCKQVIEFQPGFLSIAGGEQAAVKLHLVNVDFDSLTIETSDDANCHVNPTEIDENGDATVMISVSKRGNYTVTASNGTVSSTLRINGTSAVESIEAENGIAFDGTSVIAAGCQITIYTLEGIAAVSGMNEVSTTDLAPGVYVAVATAEGGQTVTLKINVR